MVTEACLASGLRERQALSHSDGFFGQQSSHTEILVDGSNEKSERSGELLRIAVTYEVGEMCAKGGQNVGFTEFEPPGHSVQNRGFTGKRDGCRLLEDLQAHVLRDALLGQGGVRQEHGHDLTLAT